MSKETITSVQEDLARDLYELASNHREEITCLIEEFDAHDIDTSVCLDGYERERQQQAVELGGPTDPPQAEHDETIDNDGNRTGTKLRIEAKSSLFDIL